MHACRAGDDAQIRTRLSWRQLQAGGNTHHGVEDMQSFISAKPCWHAANMQG